MNDIFISHSTKNKDLVMQMLELLQAGMGIGRERIFCTSLKSSLPSGEDFIQAIKKHIQKSTVVIAIITPEYLQSHFCMMELGAAWSQSAYLCPILAGGLDCKALEDTPLKNVQLRSLDNEDDLFSIFDELVKMNIAILDTSQFRKKVSDFRKKIVSSTVSGDSRISPDLNGYYEIELAEKRNVPSSYRCYKIKGLLDLRQNETPHPGETHWIFYHADTFPELQPGARVLIKISKTECRYFDDIGWVQNIYLADLQIISVMVR